MHGVALPEMAEGVDSIPLFPSGTQLVPLYTWMSLQSVLKTTKPVAGDKMAERWAEVMRGGRKPFVVDLASRIAELSGELPSLLIPTCAADWILPVINAEKSRQMTIFIFINGDF